ncbi:hypothetical protein FXO38_30961 [Capsicum annuum]|nr:hypothetical protein FXO38_30961 [Capsicum annuum]KAF3627720.1 hypothetical protein FXO37_29723 [Capsicum annuum]
MYKPVTKVTAPKEVGTISENQQSKPKSKPIPTEVYHKVATPKQVVATTVIAPTNESMGSMSYASLVQGESVQLRPSVVTTSNSFKLLPRGFEDNGELDKPPDGASISSN